MYYTFEDNLAFARRLISRGYTAVDACLISSNGAFNRNREFELLLAAVNKREV